MLASLKRLFELLSSRERGQMLLLVGLLLVNAMIEVVGVGIIPAYVSIVAFPEKLTEHEWVQAALGQPGQVLDQQMLLYWGSALMFVFFGLKAGYKMLLTYARARFVQNRVANLSTRLFRTYMHAPYVFHLSRNTSELLRNINQEALILGNKVLQPLVEFAAQALVLLAVVAFLTVTMPGASAFWVGLFFATAVTLVALLHTRIKALGIEAQQNRGALVRSVQEGLGGVKEVRVLGRQGLFVGRMGRAMRRMMAIERYMQVVGGAIPALMEWVAVTGLLGLTIFLFASGTPAATVVPTVALFAVALVRVKGAVTGLAQGYTQLRQNLVSVDVIYEELVALRNAVDVRGQAQPLLRSEAVPEPMRLQHQLAITGLWYRYPNTEDFALKGVELTIRKGEAVGFVGATGAGKSTLIDVILGVLSPTSGRVLADSQDIHANAAAWQANLGYVPQSIYLIDGTIRQNIALGLANHQIDDGAVDRAARAAHLMELLDRLPEGLDTVVGERGVRLSGGQRQRIAIARALYRDPEILILDEGTSALDNVTERSVMQAVDELKGERTVLMIAHRLNTVRNCDRVVFLQAGTVEAVGSYDDLILQHSEFKRLAEA